MMDREKLLPGHRGRMKIRALGGRDECIPMFKTPTMECSTRCNEDTMWEGYQPKMLLYALDELFHIFDQVKRQ